MEVCGFVQVLDPQPPARRRSVRAAAWKRGHPGMQPELRALFPPPPRSPQPLASQGFTSHPLRITLVFGYLRHGSDPEPPRLQNGPATPQVGGQEPGSPAQRLRALPGPLPRRRATPRVHGALRTRRATSGRR